MKQIKAISKCSWRDFDFVLIVTMVLAGLSFAVNSLAAEIVVAKSTFDGGPHDDAGDPLFDNWTAMECANPGVCPIFGEAVLPKGPKFFHNDGAPPPGTEGSPFGDFPGLGNLEIVDPSGTTTGLFDAPAEFTGVVAADLWFQFDWKINGITFDNNDPGLPPFLVDVVPLFYLLDGAALLIYVMDEGDVTTNAWDAMDIPLTPNGSPGHPGFWVTQAGVDDGTGFADVFAAPGVDELRIWGELTFDDPEADGVQLDNVELIMHVVPVPAALPLMLSALFGLSFIARRRA
jgi:hypothetical protein